MGMTDEKINSVLDRYERDIESVEITHGSMNPHLAHALQMIPKMRAFLLIEGPGSQDRREKVFRWLGFLQGILYCHYIYTIDEMADHNRPPDESA